MSILCEARRKFAGSQHVFSCMREDGHFGHHQSISKGYYKDESILSNATWDEGGAVSGAISEMFWNECDECLILIEDDKTLCFSCKNWLEVMNMHAEKRIVIEGHHYLVGSKGGFGGREFSLEFLDASRPAIVTDRLWSQGAIPVHFQERIPNNAQWKKADKKPVSDFSDFAQLLDP